MHVEHLLKLIDRLLRIPIVVFRVGSGNVLLSVGSGQIKACVEQTRIQLDRPLKMVNGVFVFGVFVGLDAFVELVAGPQLVATCSAKKRQGRCRYCQPS